MSVRRKPLNCLAEKKITIHNKEQIQKKDLLTNKYENSFFSNLVISYNVMEETKFPRSEISHQCSLSGSDFWLWKESGYNTLNLEKITESKRPKKGNILASYSFLIKMA